MDKDKLIEDIITRRLLNGNVQEFLTELKQADVTPAEAKTADLFGDPEIGKLVGGILESLNDNAAVEPAVGELQTYLRNSTTVTNPVGTGDKTQESFSMDKEKVTTEISEDIKKPVSSMDEDVKAIEEKVSKLGEDLASFSEKMDKMMQMFSESMDSEDSDTEDEDSEDMCDKSFSEDEKGEVQDAAGNVEETLDPEESHIEYSDSAVTIRMSRDKYNRVRKAVNNISNFAEAYEKAAEEMVSIPRSEYDELLADLEKAKGEDFADDHDEEKDDPITCIMKRLDAIEAKLTPEAKEAPVQSADDSKEDEVKDDADKKEEKEETVVVKNTSESEEPETLTKEEKEVIENHSNFSQERDLFAYLYGDN